MRKLNLVFGAFSVLLLLCVPAAGQNAPITLRAGVSKHQGLDDLYRSFNDAYRTLNVDSVASIYTETAAYLVPDDDIRIGREQVRNSFSVFFEAVRKSGQSLDITFDIVQRKVEGPIGYDVGIYTLRTLKNGKEVGKGSGKFVVVAVRDTGGRWQFQVDGYSGLKPLAGKE
ncbi:MAG TPA: DUF4440 domain-containing protein [Pyrinomonadaceae bacterium]|nr:DUF4440 domain-containing protein [Pyrinomonadaceae bacterium]